MKCYASAVVVCAFFLAGAQPQEGQPKKIELADLLKQEAARISAINVAAKLATKTGNALQRKQLFDAQKQERKAMDGYIVEGDALIKSLQIGPKNTFAMVYVKEHPTTTIACMLATGDPTTAKLAVKQLVHVSGKVVSNSGNSLEIRSATVTPK
jgi:hypothetical protein